MKTNFAVIALVIASCIVACSAQQGCTTALDPEKICLYGSANLNGFGGNMAQETCQAVNNNPFAEPGVPSYAHCENDVRANGPDCVKFYAKYQCSGLCAKCNLPLCPSYCENYAAICPIAAQSGCFQGISCGGTAGSSPQSCVDWSIDASKIPAASALTTTTTSTTHHTTTSHTTTSHDTTSEDFSGVGAVRVLSAVVALAVLCALNH